MRVASTVSLPVVDLDEHYGAVDGPSHEKRSQKSHLHYRDHLKSSEFFPSKVASCQVDCILRVGGVWVICGVTRNDLAQKVHKSEHQQSHD